MIFEELSELISNLSETEKKSEVTFVIPGIDVTLVGKVHDCLVQSQDVNNLPKKGDGAYLVF